MESLRLEFERWVGSETWAGVAMMGLLLVVAFLVSLVLAWLLVLVVTRWLTPFDGERDRRFDEQFAKLRAPIRLLSFGAILLLLARPLLRDWGDQVSHLGRITSILAGGWCVTRALHLVEAAAQARLELGSADNLEARSVFTQLRGFRNIATFLTLLVTVAFVLLSFESVRELGAGLLASAGVAGIVIGFAAQRSIATVVAGIQITFTQPIRVDDVVIVEGEWGRIEEIPLPYVVVRIWDLRRLIVPVGHFIDKPFQNWTRTSADLLGTVELHLDYSVPVEAIRAEVERVLEQSPLWDKKTWSVQVTAASDRAMVVRPLFSARDASQAWDLRCEVREKLIAFVQKNYPESLPRIRASLADSAKPAVSSSG